MTVNYANPVRTRRSRTRTAQTEPIPGTTQVQNNAGGFAWAVTNWTRLRRFLILGAEGGTFYVSEKDLIKQNHTAVLACIKENGLRTVQEIVEVSDKGLALKNDPAIFALALCATHGDAETKRLALESLYKVCRIGTHLFHFAEYINAMRGWSRSLRRAVASWYTTRRPEELAMQAIKYQQRDGWSHRDIVRLAHPAAENVEQNAVIRWMVGGKDKLGDRSVKPPKGKDTKSREYYSVSAHLPSLINAFEEAKQADTKRLIQLIVEHDLPREAVPTEKLNDVKVWEALLHKMPLMAMIRNLGKMTSIGLLAPLSEAAAKVISTLGNQQALTKARIHPLGVLIALKTYAQGHGDKGSLTWAPVQPICDALDTAFYATFKNVKPINKPVLLGLDVSASMTSNSVSGCASLSCAEGVAALSLVTAATESNYHIMMFDNGVRDCHISPKMRLDTVLKKVSDINGGGTDCSLPMLWAIKNRVKLGGFVVLTDNETWAGGVHPSEALRDYRSQFVSDAREVVVAMAGTEFSIADPNDPGALDVVGFGADTPSLISDFVRGDL